MYTGLRRKDCIYLNMSCIKDGVIVTSPYKTRKKGIKVWIPIHPNLQAVLDSLPVDEHGFFFPNLKRGYEARGLDRQLKNVFAKAVGKTSVAVEGRKRKIPVKSFHSLRSTFITRLAEANVSLAVIRSMSGHTNFNQLLRYVHPSWDSKAKAIDTLSFGPPA